VVLDSYESGTGDRCEAKGAEGEANDHLKALFLNSENELLEYVILVYAIEQESGVGFVRVRNG